MRKLLWFSKIGGNSSFSRVTRSMLKELTLVYDITVISDEPFEGTKFIKILQDTPLISYKDYKESWIKERGSDKYHLEMNMKYIVIQVILEIEKTSPDTVVVLNGIYEADFYTKILKDSINSLQLSKKKTKLMVWTPLDFVPDSLMVSNIIQADILATMSPNSVKDIQRFTSKKVHLLEHGHLLKINDTTTATASSSDILKIINKISFNKNLDLKESDIIILNANTTVARKQTIISVKAFLDYLKDSKRSDVKLWLNTNIRGIVENAELCTLVFANKSSIILTDGALSDSELELVYNRCAIGLQTSSGEGFSMTNIEHAVYGSIQVVPDFLATGNHFSNGKGILIPIKENTIDAEVPGRKITVASIEICDVTRCIEKAVNLILFNEQEDLVERSKSYAKKFTWQSIAKQFIEIETTY